MKKFLIKKLGSEEGKRIFKESQIILKDLIDNIENKTDSQIKLLKNALLPRIAVYKVLLEDETYSDMALTIIEDYMINVVGYKMHKEYSKLDRIPGFFFIFRKVFSNMVSTKDLWQAEVDKTDKQFFTVTINECFWYDTFVEYDCPELCASHCKCDDITYSGLKKLSYTRHETLGTGGKCCDFRFSINKAKVS